MGLGQGPVNDIACHCFDVYPITIMVGGKGDRICIILMYNVFLYNYIYIIVVNVYLGHIIIIIEHIL